MDSDIAIKIENLSKVYKLYDKPKDRFKETFHPFRKKYHHDFYALKNISFEVKKGETVGIIGKNGAGKSTLLQIIYNVVDSTSGNIVVNGNVSALLELGSSFNPEFTGIENVYLNGAIMGYSDKEMDEKLDDILSFADIGEFVHQPVKMYSTGMFVRLAFSVATTLDPDILIIDEALSVGDIFFQAKSTKKLRKMIDEKNVTLLFVSHDLWSVKSICKKALLLEGGKMIDYGDCAKVIENYHSIKIESEQEIIAQDPKKQKSILEKDVKDKTLEVFEDNASFLKKAAYQRIQNGKANFANIQLLNENEDIISFVNYEQNVILRMSIEINEDLHLLDYGYQIQNEDGIEVVYSDSITENKSLLNVKKGDRYVIDWNFKTSLTHIHGKYNVLCALGIPMNYEKVMFEFCDRVPISVQFQMQPKAGIPICGFVHWHNKVDIIKY